jgi:hypothetical protein
LGLILVSIFYQNQSQNQHPPDGGGLTTLIPLEDTNVDCSHEIWHPAGKRG